MIVRQLFPDLNLTSMLPAIDDVIMNRYNRFPPQFQQIYRMMKSTRAMEQVTEVTGLTTLGVVAEGANVRYDTPLPGFNRTYVHLQYGLGYKVSKIAVDDDQFGVIKKLSLELGKSAQETREQLAAFPLNQAFNTAYAGADGQPLFSANHPLAGGGVQSNILPIASDPDVVSLQMALTQARMGVNQRGQKQRIVFKTLVVPPTLEFIAAELLGGTQRSDTANNAINSFKRRSGMPAFEDWMVWDYLTDQHAWFIMADSEDTELRWYDREAFNTLHAIDFDSRSLKTAGWMRSSVGFNGYNGVLGVPSS